MKYNTGALPADDAVLVAARRLQLGRERRPDHAGARRHGPLLGQTAVRLDFEPDRQHRRAVRIRSTRGTRPRFRSTRIPDKYKPAATGGVAASYELDVTDQSFRFPQTWRTNIGVDRRLPWGLVGTLDYIYNRDINAPGLPQRQPAGRRQAPTRAWTIGRAGSPRRPARRCCRASRSHCRRARRRGQERAVPARA